MIRTVFWYSFAWSYLFLTYPLLWRIRFLKWRGREEDRLLLVERFTAYMSRVLLRATGSKVQINGIENVPANGPVLIVSNHQGHMDSLVIHGYINKTKGFVSIVEVLRYPIIRTWLAQMKCVFLDRKDPRQSLTCIKQGIEYLKDGHSMVVFPEGRLNDGGPTGEFQRGWLKLSTKTGVPILPVSIQNTYLALSYNGKKVRSASIVCTIHPLISTEELLKKDEEAFLDMLRTLTTPNGVSA